MSIELPLKLRPVVRSREAGQPDGAHLPYHPAILIVDAAGRLVADVASDPDDLRAGRGTLDPHRLVSRATQLVTWLEDIHARLSAWATDLAHPTSLSVRPIVSVDKVSRRVEAGVQFCSAVNEEFDRITTVIDILARDAELERAMTALQQKVLRRHAAATSILAELQEAVDSWRSAEAVTARDRPPLRIVDSDLEH